MGGGDDSGSEVEDNDVNSSSFLYSAVPSGKRGRGRGRGKRGRLQPAVSSRDDEGGSQSGLPQQLPLFSHGSIGAAAPRRGRKPKQTALKAYES